MVFCGAAFKQPIDELIQIYKERTGIEINASYSGMGAIYSQVLLSRKGDLFIVPSPDQMEKAKAAGVIYHDSIKNFAYIAPVINVKKGNPKNIRSLEDLARPDIKIGIGNPKTVFVGSLAVEIIDKDLDPDKKAALKKNIVVYAEDFAKLSFLILVGQVDAIIGLNYLSEVYPDKIEAIRLKPEQIHRIGAGQAATLVFSKNIESSRKFIELLLSKEGQNIFKKYHYFSTKDEADKWIGIQKPVGGNYVIPHDWLEN